MQRNGDAVRQLKGYQWDEMQDKKQKNMQPKPEKQATGAELVWVGPILGQCLASCEGEGGTIRRENNV